MAHQRVFWRSSAVARGCQALLLGGLLIGLSACGSSKSTSNVEELRQENDELRAELREAREEASSIQRGKTIQVLSTDVYFKSGSAELTDKGVEELKSVAQEIRTRFSDRTIRIEGYTDSRPIGEQLKDKYPSNWELSAARSARVARHLRWTHNMDPERFEVVGFGPYHPVATNETAEGRRKNRRVRVAVLDSEPTGEEPSLSDDSNLDTPSDDSSLETPPDDEGLQAPSEDGGLRPPDEQ